MVKRNQFETLKNFALSLYGTIDLQVHIVDPVA